jgi:phage gpG-like protein
MAKRKVTTNVSVDTTEVRKRFIGFRIRAKNFTPVLRWAFKQLQEAHLKNFASEGRASNSPWRPLDPEYASWKLEKYGNNGILVGRASDGSDLRASLIFSNTRGSIRNIITTGEGTNSAEFGTDLPYAKFHQTGTRDMPARKVVYVPQFFKYKMKLAVLEHILYGQKDEFKVGDAYVSLRRGLLP